MISLVKLHYSLVFFLLELLSSGAISPRWDEEYRKKIKFKSGNFCFKLGLLIEEWMEVIILANWVKWLSGNMLILFMLLLHPILASLPTVDYSEGI